MLHRRKLAAVLVLGALAAVGFASASKVVMEGDGARRDALDKMQGMTAPGIAGSEWLNTDATSLADFKGKVVMLDFWGVWCGPCVRSIPGLKKMYEEYKDQGLVILGVHTTNQGEKAASFVAENGIEYPIVIDDNDRTVGRYKVDSYPDVYLIDHNGVLRYADVANGNHENIVKAIEELLAERNASEN
jgi:thiol-disulfide isomerase/thioredoxin